MHTHTDSVVRQTYTYCNYTHTHTRAHTRCYVEKALPLIDAANVPSKMCQ